MIQRPIQTGCWDSLWCIWVWFYLIKKCCCFLCSYLVTSLCCAVHCFLSYYHFLYTSNCFTYPRL